MSKTKLCVMGMYSIFLAEKIDRARMYASEKNVEYLLLDMLQIYINLDYSVMLDESLDYSVLWDILAEKEHKPLVELIEIIDAYVVFCKHGLFLKEEIVGILKKFYKITLEKI